VTDPKTTITITLDKGSLIAKLSEQLSLKLIFRSDTKFSFDGAAGTVDEFVIENGKVIKLNLNNEGFTEWNKTK
jgi:hypothetical protein